jgi:pimeloyl-ACP methyl ester carboxylesterase
MRSLGFYDRKKQLKNIAIPTLVISGASDTTVALDDQVQLAQGISGCIHKIIPDAGHAIIIDQPARFNQVLIDFLRV